MNKQRYEEALNELIAFKYKSWDGMSEEMIDVAIEALELVIEMGENKKENIRDESYD